VEASDRLSGGEENRVEYGLVRLCNAGEATETAYEMGSVHRGEEGVSESHHEHHGVEVAE